MTRLRIFLAFMALGAALMFGAGITVMPAVGW